MRPILAAITVINHGNIKVLVFFVEETIYLKKNIARIVKRCPKNISSVVTVSNVLTKRHFECFSFSFHNLTFVIIQVLSQFECLIFVKINVFEFCHNLIFVIFRYFVLSQFEFFIYATIWVFFSFVTIWFFSFVTIWVFEFCHNLIFWF